MRTALINSVEKGQVGELEEARSLRPHDQGLGLGPYSEDDGENQKGL